MPIWERLREHWALVSASESVFGDSVPVITSHCGHHGKVGDTLSPSHTGTVRPPWVGDVDEGFSVAAG